jgi:two-component system sensor histidine kinase BaeS
MLRSLRFKLPALFLAGVVLAGLVSTALAIRLFQDYARSRALSELRRESQGIVRLYIGEAGLRKVPKRLSASLEEATGDRVFYVPVVKNFSIFQDLDALPATAVDFKRLERAHVMSFDLHRPGHEYVAVARPIKLGSETFGAIVVAKQKADLRNRWLTLVDRLAIAFGAGVLVAALLAWYLSRRITRPVLALARAADAVSAGRYDVELPVAPADEIGHLSERFRQMAARLGEAEERERNFLMTVTHELRTPLTAIRGHVEALREGVVDDPALRRYSLDVIAEEGARLERLVGDILDLAKLDAHRFTVLHEEVDMEHLCDRVYTTFAEEARRRGIDYRRAIDARPVIVTDGDRVLQIISNLLANAFRWTPDGGRIELALGQANGSVSVAVGDTGPGISAEERDRIFRPFWTRDASGSGLGLAIARELAVALGGRIELESQPGRGSRFRLVLPLERR